MSSKKSFLGVFIRGFAMGTADVIPGVSGGTIAFITGIYEELIETISNLKLSLLKIWRKEGFKTFWKQLNGNFLIALFLGIGISIVSLAKLIEYLIHNHPIPLWSFFFGLILASIWLMGKTIEKWNIASILSLLIGTAIAFYVSIVSPSEGSTDLLYIFISGMLAICAMILPGISGSFILLLLGSYITILGSLSGLLSALKDKNWDLVSSNGITILVFILGCIVGLISFSKLLNYLFKKYKNTIISLLTGFLIGSLYKIWPWKEVISTRTNSKGETVPFIERSISPFKYELLMNNSQLISAIVFCLIGISIIIISNFFSKKN